jgi:acetyl-CoA carboxylase biotin carboxylase subunit
VFRKVLVANRGEIARRVMRTCRDLGIATVAVHSEADADEPHVREADEAVLLGPAPASDSYLRVDAVVSAAVTTGADAIHPGYGFLSENAELAEACARAGVTFIGPAADTIRLMGDKAAAKRHLEAAGVPVVPGVHGEDLDDDAIVTAAEHIGYPVLVKAVAGGGGKGMRAVHDPSELAEELAAARREARAAFGDDRVILEKLVTGPRHVEVQVLGDAHGTVIHVLERECSVQRRHQKVVEETPSPAVDADLRARMGEAAVTAAQAVDYLGAGTVEFLLSDTGDFYFLEMNTRLQVEHPVTELVTGIDLVEAQLRVATGEPLGISQEDVAATGHALEVRLYAEDVAAGFLPATGPVLRFVRPAPRADVRIDSGIEDGSDVSRFYDPMLAKLVVHGADRSEAIDRMTWLLERTSVLGVTTNVDFLRACVDHPAFRSGDITTGFIDEHLDGWTPPETTDELLVVAAVALQAAQESDPGGSGDGDLHSPWRALGPWRTGQIGGWRVTFEDRDATHRLQVTGRGGSYRVVVPDGRTVSADVHRGPDPGGALELQVDGREVPAVVRTHRAPGADRTEVWAHVRGVTRRLVLVPPTRHADPGLAGAGSAFISPMPGAVSTVAVSEGDHVPAGTTLMVVEAMKMEHPIKAPVAGTVTALHVRAGDPVDGGAPLLAFEPDAEEEHP